MSCESQGVGCGGVRRCNRWQCPNSRPAEPHECPYAVEINADHVPCNCCDACVQECADAAKSQGTPLAEAKVPPVDVVANRPSDRLDRPRRDVAQVADIIDNLADLLQQLHVALATVDPTYDKNVMVTPLPGHMSDKVGGVGQGDGGVANESGAPLPQNIHPQAFATFATSGQLETIRYAWGPDNAVTKVADLEARVSRIESHLAALSPWAPGGG